MSRPLRLAMLLLVTLLLPVVGSRPPGARAQTTMFQGTAAGTPGPLDLHAGLVIVHGRSSGLGNFTVSLVTQDPGATVSNSYNNRYLLIDAVGTYNGAAAAILQQDGSYFLDVSQASGPYQLSVEQPSPATVLPVSRTTFSGKGQQVTSPFTLPPGSYTVTVQTDNSALRIRLYSIDDLGGTAIVSPSTGYYGDELIDTTIPPSLLSVPVTIDAASTNPDGTPIDGTFFFSVDPEGTGTGTWTVSITESSSAWRTPATATW